MTLSPLGPPIGANLPPPPPSADPREPSPVAAPRTRSGAQTPQKARSPLSSRDVSPIRGSKSPVADHPSPLLAPFPRAVPAAGTPPPAASLQASLGQLGHHLSRPSSPSSIHSSGSAIFERDIEQPSLASLSLNPNAPQSHTLSHRPSRMMHLAHGSTMDHTVPAVLDDAVEALTQGGPDTGGLENIEIEAPAPNTSGMGRPSSSSLTSMSASARKVSTGPAAVFGATSRSPSPISVGSRTSSMASPSQSPPIMAAIASHNIGAAWSPGAGASPASPTSSTKHDGQLSASPARPAVPRRISTGPQLPGGWGFKEGRERTVSDEPQASVPAPAPAPATPLNSAPHLSPGKPQNHRLSFVSYNDMLLSIPTQVTSFGEITSGTVSPEHLPGTVSPSLSARSPVAPPSFNGLPPPDGSPGSVPNMSATPSQAGVPRQVEPNGSWDGNAGEAEWQRQGLGKGLEQRLEDLHSDH